MVWLPFFYFPIYWVANHPNWLIFFQRCSNHQPVYDDSSSRNLLDLTGKDCGPEKHIKTHRNSLTSQSQLGSGLRMSQVERFGPSPRLWFGCLGCLGCLIALDDSLKRCVGGPNGHPTGYTHGLGVGFHKPQHRECWQWHWLYRLYHLAFFLEGSWISWLHSKILECMASQRPTEITVATSPKLPSRQKLSYCSNGLSSHFQPILEEWTFWGGSKNISHPLEICYFFNGKCMKVH